MNDDVMDDETLELVERRLTAGLHALVDGAQPPPAVRERLAVGLTAPPPSRRRWIPAAAAAAVLVALVAASLGFRDGGDDTVDLATDPAPTVTTTTVAADPTTTTTAVDATTVPPAPTTTVVAPATTQAVAPVTPPPTTALVCRDSADPACGAFRWDPVPTNQAASLSITTPDGPIVAGSEVPVTLTMSDPDGPVTLDCYVVEQRGPSTASGSGPCSTTRQTCPDRYGPWNPPAPQPGNGVTDVVLLFEEPGTYTVTATVSPADGCDNVDPYRSGATASITVQVQPQP